MSRVCSASGLPVGVCCQQLTFVGETFHYSGPSPLTGELVFRGPVLPLAPCSDVFLNPLMNAISSLRSWLFKSSAVPSVAQLLRARSPGFHMEHPQQGPEVRAPPPENWTFSREATFREGVATRDCPGHRDCLPRGWRPPASRGTGADFPARGAEVRQPGGLFKLRAGHSQWPFQMPAATGQRRRCSLECLWAVHAQVTAALANGNRELICSQGPNWLGVQFCAYYFKAVSSPSLAGLLETSGNNDQNASVCKEAAVDSSTGSQGKAHVGEPTCSKEKCVFINQPQSSNYMFRKHSTNLFLNIRQREVEGGVCVCSCVRLRACLCVRQHVACVLNKPSIFPSQRQQEMQL